MAAMVKTYLLLCVVGLCTTLFIILITYGDDHPRLSMQSQIRRIKPPPDILGNSTGNMILDTSKFQHAMAPTDDEDSKRTIKNFDWVENRELTNGGIADQLTSQRILEENKNTERIANDSPDNTDAKKYPPKIGADQVNVFPDHAQMIKTFHNFQADIQNTRDQLRAGIQDVKDQVAKAALRPIPAVQDQPAVTKLEPPAIQYLANIQEFDSPADCKPQNNIVLLKTHKCSSSTVQNILYRWGDERNLSFVLPKGGMPYLGSPALFNKDFAIESADGVYNILANHARFSERGMSAIMPPDTVYISILRNPTTQYESLFTYYRHQQRYEADLAHFLTNPYLYFVKEPLNTHIVGRNSMLFDLGLDARHMEGNSDKVNQWINMLNNKFSLVLIAEHFTESLILLKDLLCWSMDDIVYLNQNARSAGSVKRITPSMKQGILKWNSADAKLYNHFNQSLWRKIETYGFDRMKRAVQVLNSKNALLTADCVQNKLQSGDSRMWYPPGIKMESFQVNPHAKNKQLCDRVTRPELTYMKQLADKQRRRNIGIEQQHGIHNPDRFRLRRDTGHSKKYRKQLKHIPPPPQRRHRSKR